LNKEIAFASLTRGIRAPPDAHSGAHTRVRWGVPAPPARSHSCFAAMPRHTLQSRVTKVFCDTAISPNPNLSTPIYIYGHPHYLKHFVCDRRLSRSVYCSFFASAHCQNFPHPSTTRRGGVSERRGDAADRVTLEGLLGCIHAGPEEDALIPDRGPRRGPRAPNTHTKSLRKDGDS